MSAQAIRSSDSAQPVRPPGLLRIAMEMRAPLEFAASVAAAPVLASAPRGDGHPVIVYPGFLGTDLSTRPMRRLLRWLGNDAQGWGLGRNVGPDPAVLDAALLRIKELAETSGQQVSLVGWSLGGIYARELAKRAPNRVRSVVTLGSPFTGPAGATNAELLFARLNSRRPYERISREALRVAPPVPTTSIYTKSDGIVAWQCSVEEPGEMTENIAVEASHIGLGVNPFALYALADRLSQAQGQWQPFDRSGARQLFFR